MSMGNGRRGWRRTTAAISPARGSWPISWGGDYRAARNYHERALANDLATYGADHPAVARDRNNLGSAWQDLGDYPKAIGYLRAGFADPRTQAGIGASPHAGRAGEPRRRAGHGPERASIMPSQRLDYRRIGS